MPETPKKGPPPIPAGLFSKKSPPPLPPGALVQKKGPPPLPWKRTPEVEEGTQPVVTGTSAAVQNALVSNVEEEKEERVGFTEAARLLKPEGYDLEKVRADTVKLHDKLGIVRALQAKGVVQSADQYGALFDGAELSAKGLQSFLDRFRNTHQTIKDHYSNDPRSPEELFAYFTSEIMPIFNSGHLSYRELWKTLMDGSEIRNVLSDDFRHALRSDGLDGFDFRKVRLGDIPNLADLHNLPKDDQESAFQRAYWQALKAPEEAPKPSVLFTTDRMSNALLINGRDKIKGMNLSALECAQQMMKVKNHPVPISPADDLLRWRTQFEAVADQFKSMRTGGEYKIPYDKIPNYNTVSIYPLHVLPNGRILSLRFIPETFEPFLMSEDPGYSERQYGVRYVTYS